MISPDKEYAEEINTRIEFSDVLPNLIGKGWLSGNEVTGEQWLERQISKKT